MTPLLWLLPILLALLGFWLLRRAGNVREEAGIPDGTLIYSDTSSWEEPPTPLLSRRHGLVGRPDYLFVLRERGEEITIPVEVKSGRRPNTPHAGHVLQLATYCLLVEDQMGRRPPFGVLHYSDATLEIEFDDELRRRVLETADEIRRARSADDVDRQHHQPGRCVHCGYRRACGDQALV